MTPDEEYEFYAQPENQEPQGSPRRRWPDAALTPNEAAERLGMSRTHLHKLLDRGEIVFHRVGRDRRIRVCDLLEFEARRQRDRRELAERFAHQQQTREGAVDEVKKLL